MWILIRASIRTYANFTRIIWRSIDPKWTSKTKLIIMHCYFACNGISQNVGVVSLSFSTIFLSDSGVRPARSYRVRRLPHMETRVTSAVSKKLQLSQRGSCSDDASGPSDQSNTFPSSFRIHGNFQFCMKLLRHTTLQKHLEMLKWTDFR